jgi:uncharacterized protein
MHKIGLLSDTHGWLDPRIPELFHDVDEIWHAGDIGASEVTDALALSKPLMTVYGNIDAQTLRRQFPEDVRSVREGLSIWMTHIGGYPGHYAPRVLKLLKSQPPPDLFICGHSHIAKVQRDERFGMLTMNPGAAGKHGFHRMRTVFRFAISEGRVHDLEVIELGLRGKLI